MMPNNTSLQALEDLRLPVGSLDTYIHYVNQIPLLSQAEELELAVKLQKNNDLASARALVLAHLRYVVRVARGYLGYGLPLNDLIQEGNIGLMKAVKRFNPDVGVRLVTFAMHWIKAEIHDFVLRNWRIVKVATTKSQRKLFFNLRNMKKNLGWLTQEEVAEVAKDLKVKPETVREMEMRLSTSDTPFDGDHEEDDETAYFAPAGYLEDHRFNPEQQLETTDWALQSQNNLNQAMKKLDARSQEILSSRWLADEKATLQELADKFQVSAERIRQLEKHAMQKLKAALTLND
jgi:RNA polymerase sigma-32 factor